jgi:peptidoglycan/LPS O-acetylase OafA/YrhL
MRSSATIAIVATRLRKEVRLVIVSVAACALLAYLQRNDDAQAQFAAGLVFGTLTGITLALLQRGAGRFRELELCEQSAPLYGRELARATALVPCIIVTLALASYWGVTASYSHPSALYAALCVPAVYAATLTALCATVRLGIARVLYVGVACALAAIAFVLALHVPIAGVCTSALAGFIALRQYGEALARYDPV